MYITEAVWKRIPNSRSSKMKGALTAADFRLTRGDFNNLSVEDRSDRAGSYVQSVADR